MKTNVRLKVSWASVLLWALPVLLIAQCGPSPDLEPRPVESNPLHLLEASQTTEGTEGTGGAERVNTSAQAVPLPPPVPCPPTQAPVPSGVEGAISDPTPTFSWSAVAGATSYTLYVLRVSDEAVMLRKTNIPGTSFTAVDPLPADVPLRWKVKGESPCGPGPYSPSVHFIITDPGPSPAISITAPAEGENVWGTVAIQTQTSADVTRVELYIDGILTAVDTAAPFEYLWNTWINPTPAPNHPMDYGYYYVEYKNPADFDTARAQVNGYTNVYLATLGTYVYDNPGDWIPLLRTSLINAVREERRIHLLLELNVPAYAQRLDAVLNAAAPYWSHVVRVEIADEPNWSRAEMERRLRDVRQKIRARGLPMPPQGFGATSASGGPIGPWKDAPGLNWIGIECYIPAPGNADSQTNIDNLKAVVNELKGQVPVGKRITLVMMAYDRNGQWTRIDTLRDLQMPAYLLGYQDPRVISLLMFAYTRPGGSRDHLELTTPHKLIAERILGRAVPGAVYGPRTISVKATTASAGVAWDRVTVWVSDPG